MRMRMRKWGCVALLSHWRVCRTAQGNPRIFAPLTQKVTVLKYMHRCTGAIPVEQDACQPKHTARQTNPRQVSSPARTAMPASEHPSCSRRANSNVSAWHTWPKSCAVSFGHCSLSICHSSGKRTLPQLDTALGVCQLERTGSSI